MNGINDAAPIGGVTSELAGVVLWNEEGTGKHACGQSKGHDRDSGNAELNRVGWFGRELELCVFTLLLGDDVVIAVEFNHGRDFLVEIEFLVET